MWLHTHGKRRSYIEREKHSDFRKWREIEERKVDFLQQIEYFFRGDIYTWERMLEKGGFFLEDLEQERMIRGGEKKEEPGILWLSWRKSMEKWERSDCSQGSSRCVPSYSRNSYSCSISPCVHFWIFNILLVGVDVKGHKLFCWDWSFTSLPYFDSDYFMCHGCLRKYITPCLNVIILCFRLNPILHCSLYSVLIPWINTWSGGYLCLLINIFCSFLLRVLLRFYFFSIPFPACCPSLCHCIWAYIEEWRKC